MSMLLELSLWLGLGLDLWLDWIGVGDEIVSLEIEFGLWFELVLGLLVGGVGSVGWSWCWVCWLDLGLSSGLIWISWWSW